MSQISLVGITLAVNKMAPMVDFYQSVFGMNLHPIDVSGVTLFHGKLSGVDVMLCPHEIAGINAEQNRHQLKFQVSNLSHAVNLALGNGGSLLNSVTETEGKFAAAVRDPDGNSIEFEEVSDREIHVSIGQSA
jgi:predicted enzyme related to lactoylglutathione lyase